MKEITYVEWTMRFHVTDSNAEDTVSDIDDSPDGFAFFDNGAVKDLISSNFVIKSDQVKNSVCK